MTSRPRRSSIRSWAEKSHTPRPRHDASSALKLCAADGGDGRVCAGKAGRASSGFLAGIERVSRTSLEPRARISGSNLLHRLRARGGERRFEQRHTKPAKEYRLGGSDFGRRVYRNQLACGSRSASHPSALPRITAGFKRKTVGGQAGGPDLGRPDCWYGSRK